MPPMKLTLQNELRLRQVQLESAELDEEQLRHCLIAAWHSMLLERQMIHDRVMELTGLDIQVDSQKIMPFDVCRLRG
jgi:hypothetical protein